MEACVESVLSLRRPTVFGAALCAAALILMSTPGAVARAGEPPEEIDPAASCVTGACHGALQSYRILHWKELAGAGECQKCHEGEPGAHEFSVDDSSEKCLGCHEELAARIESAETVHPALDDGCSACHDPHGGAVEALLIDIQGTDLKELCFQCHDSDLIDFPFAHGPAEQGACVQCHDPHASPRSAMLRGEGIGLCGRCHQELAEKIESARTVHAPVEDGCLDCHGPHGGPHAKLLRAEKRALCNECHDDVVEEAEGASVDHAPTTTGAECLNCHEPHAADAAPNLKRAQPELCLGCHDRPVQSGDAQLLDVKGWLDTHETWHAPIRDGGCSACHRPHGGESFRMLKQPFPERFYASFSTEAYGLCFSCHRKALATSEWTRALTGFRDGNRNLHFVHVNNAERGRTCRACHDAHATSDPRLVRDETPYGKWAMPLQYERTETGGSCHPGCHKLEKYDRNAENYTKER